MRVGVLGELTLEADDGPVVIGARKVRAVLTLLAVHAGRPVPTTVITDVLWGDEPTPTSRKAIQGYVSALRKVLPAGAISTSAEAYTLVVDPDDVDLHRTERLIVEAGRDLAAGRPEHAAQGFDEALGLWRGPALLDLTEYPTGATEAARIDELRRAAQEDLAEARLALGQHAQMIAGLEAAVAAAPLRERRWAQLMTGLYRGGRQAEALRAYQRLKHLLAEELGLDPSPELAELEEAILRRDPGLSPPPARPFADRADAAAKPPEAPPGLPSFPSTFVGRESELEAIGAALARSRVVTITGPGGTGKTRLAVATAGQSTVPAAYVRLESAQEARDVPATFSDAIGMADPHGATTEAITRFAASHLAGRPFLLVVDNVEHVLDAAAELVGELVRACPTMTVLATGRQALGIAGERVFVAPGLSVPHELGPLSIPDADSESVILFCDRAGLDRSALDDESLRAIITICRRVDGLPLAIELAANAGGTVPLDVIASRLGTYLMASTGRSGAESRHRTMAAALRWSVDALQPDERDLLVALTAFAESFTFDAAEVVGAPIGSDVPLALGGLVRNSLVSAIAGPKGVQRYRLLAVIREFAITELGSEAALDAARRAHSAYYGTRAEEAERDLHGPRAALRLRQITDEVVELRSAVRYSIGQGDLETGARLAGSLRWFFGRLCMIDESSEWMARVVERRRELPDELRLQVLVSAGTLAFTMGRFAGAPELVAEAVTLAREVGNEGLLAMAITVRGVVAAYTGDTVGAVSDLNEAEVLCRRIGDHYCLGWLLTERAVAYRRAGRFGDAEECLRDALDEFGGMGDTHSMIMPTLQMGLVAHQLGNLDEAEQWCGKAIALCREIGDRQQMHMSLCCAGRVAIDQALLPLATERIVGALTDLADAENVIGLAIGLEGLALIAGQRDRPRDAVVLWACADRVRTDGMIPLSQDRATERSAALDCARRLLGDAAFEAAWASGLGATRSEAVALGIARG